MMAATGASSPLIKDEPEDQFFLPHHGQRSMAGGYQSFSPSQAGFHQFNTNGESIDPNRLTMNGSGVAMPHGNNFGTTFSQSTYNGASGQTPNPHGPYSKGLDTFDDDDLGLGQHDTQFQYDMQQNMYNGATSLSIDQNAMNGYSHTPDGEPLASPYSVNFNYAHLRNLQNQSNALHSPAAFSGSSNNGSDMMQNGMTQRRPGITLMQRKHSSSNSMRSPMTPKTPVISSLKIGSAEHASFPTQPIRTAHSHRHQKTLSGQWDQTPSSLTSFPGSEYSSPIQGIHPNPQISDILKGASMPAKLNNGNAPALQSQEMKRRRRRESHNLVERRRRDNINERIQELSHLVPLHRLEDEKVRKALQNNSPLSPTLAGLSQPPNGMSPPQATSGLAGPGARRATAGNITTGIPIEEKDKGPNKGDILNGAVSWTRDLMWMLHLKMQQQEDLANIIADLGGTFPFEETEDERRMHTELMDAMQKNDGAKFHYSRAPGSGLRVPKHTDVKGDTIGASNTDQLNISLSPDNHSTGDVGQAGMGGPGQYWSGHNSGGSGAGSISFKEEDEYGMDLTQ